MQTEPPIRAAVRRGTFTAVVLRVPAQRRAKGDGPARGCARVRACASAAPNWNFGSELCCRMGCARALFPSPALLRRRRSSPASARPKLFSPVAVAHLERDFLLHQFNNIGDPQQFVAARWIFMLIRRHLYERDCLQHGPRRKFFPSKDFVYVAGTGTYPLRPAKLTTSPITSLRITCSTFWTSNRPICPSMKVKLR